MKKTDRRTIIKGAAAAGAMQIASPFIIQARGETPVRIGILNSLVGDAELAASALGAQRALEYINSGGFIGIPYGILGRPVELLVENCSNDVETGIRKARKLVERNQVSVLIADVDSSTSQTLVQITNDKKKLHIVLGGHTDSTTGTDCKWNVYRVGNTPGVACKSVADVLFKKYGKKWHFITPDYAFGHTLQRNFEINLKRLGGTMTGSELAPLGITDYSAYLIKARAASPDVLIVLLQDNDMVNCLKQIVQFGLHKQFAVAGAQQELESLKALPPEARLGTWMLDWYWKQPGDHMVADFVAGIREFNGGKVPTARHWFGFASVWTLALVADREKTIDSLKLAQALSNFELPPEVKLQPNKCYYRKGDHQLVSSAFVGEAIPNGKEDPEDLFRVDQVVPGDTTALPEAESGCKLQWPA